jgi:hypothetical protein
MVILPPSPETGGHMRLSVLLIGVAASLMLAGLVSLSRALADDVDTCNNGTGDQSIAACTRLINSGRWRGPGLAPAYKNGAQPTRARATTTAPLPTTARRSGSIPNTPPRTTTGATRTMPRATPTAPSPITARRSGSIPNSPPPLRSGCFACSGSSPDASS